METTLNLFSINGLHVLSKIFMQHKVGNYFYAQLHCLFIMAENCKVRPAVKKTHKTHSN
jgi:membrane glycosyltransferase